MSKNDQLRHPWVVDFSFKFRDDQQRGVVTELGILAHDVVRLWLQALMPAAVVLEPKGMPVKTVVCPSREAARRFIRTFGGSLRGVKHG